MLPENTLLFKLLFRIITLHRHFITRDLYTITLDFQASKPALLTIGQIGRLGMADIRRA